jgi:predicted ATPase/DNA-binding SARP family transcriptional activator
MRAEIRLLGAFQVVVDGRPIPPNAWRRRDATALVKLLALTPGHRLLRDQVVDALWPDLLTEQALPRLHKAAHYARSAVGVRDGVVLDDGAVTLFPHADVVVDVDHVDSAAPAARSGDLDAATEVVRVYAGDLLPDDLFEPWAEEPRDLRRGQYLEALRTLGRWDLVLEADPFDEDAHLQLVSHHLRRGDRRSTLTQLDKLDRVLEELGAGSGETANALREEALRLPLPDFRWEVQAARRAPVPAPATPTIGRDRETADVLDLLRRAQLVTLLGPGGVGKTRLAVEVARRWTESTAAGACYVDLTLASDADEVPHLICRSLGIEIAAADAGLSLEETFAGGSLLLVLDNFEHVADAAGVVGRITSGSPEVRVLTTSRARLRIAGENVYDVAPLGLDNRPEEPGVATEPADAVALFAQSAVAIDPDFRLAQYLDDVDAICRMVDGLPLAIELAAGHVRTLPPSLLRARLRARLGSATGAARDLPARQQTIPATIDWSLQLLGDAERRLFVRLGVFAGPVPLALVEDVCADPDDDVVGCLARLVDQSLVRRIASPGHEPRFGLLEVVRERAAELLTGDEEVAVRDRHAAHLAGFLDDLEEQRWETERRLDDVMERLPEIRAAQAWAQRRGDADLAARLAAGLADFWHREGHHAEGRAWVAAALANREQLDDRLVARLHLAAGIVEWPRDPSVARLHWERAVEAFRELGHDRYLAYSMALAAVTHIGEDESYAASLARCDEAIDLARRSGDQPLTARALNMKGELARVHGDDVLALAAYEEGRDLAIAAHDEANLAVFLGNLSFLAEHRGDFVEARRLSMEALRLRWSLGRRMMAGWALAELAGAEVGLGHLELAARLIGAADSSLTRAGVDRHPCDVPEYDRVVARLRRELGEGTFDLLQAEGAVLSLDDAVALALTDPEAVASP